LDHGGGGAQTSGNIVWSTNDTNQGLEGIELGRTPVNYPQGYAVPAGTFQQLQPIPTPRPVKTPPLCYNAAVQVGGQIKAPNVICPQ